MSTVRPEKRYGRGQNYPITRKLSLKIGTFFIFIAATFYYLTVTKPGFETKNNLMVKILTTKHPYVLKLPKNLG